MHSDGRSQAVANPFRPRSVLRRGRARYPYESPLSTGLYPILVSTQHQYSPGFSADHGYGWGPLR